MGWLAGSQAGRQVPTGVLLPPPVLAALPTGDIAVFGFQHQQKKKNPDSFWQPSTSEVVLSKKSNKNSYSNAERSVMTDTDFCALVFGFRSSSNAHLFSR